MIYIYMILVYRWGREIGFVGSKVAQIVNIGIEHLIYARKFM